MASNKTRTRTIRIANETADYFENLPLNRIVECVHALMESGKLKFDGAEVSLDGGGDVHTPVHADLPLKALADIEVMVGLFGLSLEKAVKDIDDLMNDGSISVTDGHLVCTLPDWAKRVEEVCHDRCIPLASMGKKIVEMIERGQI